MRIANPIYDVVFKYLMEDEESARLVIGEIIGTEILEISLMPQESTVEIDGKDRSRAPISVYRLDFSARIKTAGGEELQVVIEIQKAKFSSDIQRFRRYLGEQYGKSSVPIISIYFLGHRLESIDAPVIKVGREYVDSATGEPIRKRESFIESLTHDSFIIQIPFLAGHRRTDLEKMLTVFDQSLVTNEAGAHFMTLQEEEIPPKYRSLLRRLRRAQEDEEVRNVMDVEDDIIAELEDKERLIERLDLTLQEKEKTIEEKEKTIEENKKTIEENKNSLIEKEKTIEENKKTIEENKKNLIEKEIALEEQAKIIAELKSRLS